MILLLINLLKKEQVKHFHTIIIKFCLYKKKLIIEFSLKKVGPIDEQLK